MFSCFFVAGAAVLAGGNASLRPSSRCAVEARERCGIPCKKWPGGECGATGGIFLHAEVKHSTCCPLPQFEACDCNWLKEASSSWSRAHP